MIQPDPTRFRALTALAPLRLEWEEGRLQLQTAQTVLLPADGYEVRVHGELALLAAPAVDRVID